MKHTLLILVLLFSSFIAKAGPSIQLWQPGNNAVLEPNMWTTLSSGANNAASITYFVNNIYYCQVNQSPYNCGWFTPPSGTHSIRAVAKGYDGAEKSQTVYVSIKGAVVQAAPPTVSLWQPSNGAGLQPGTWTTLSAGATNASSVTWYVNGAQYCVTTASPYNCGWQVPDSSGTITIKAVARNSAGATAEQSV